MFKGLCIQFLTWFLYCRDYHIEHFRCVKLSTIDIHMYQTQSHSSYGKYNAVPTHYIVGIIDGKPSHYQNISQQIYSK